MYLSSYLPICMPLIRPCELQKSPHSSKHKNNNYVESPVHDFKKADIAFAPDGKIHDLFKWVWTVEYKYMSELVITDIKTPKYYNNTCIRVSQRKSKVIVLGKLCIKLTK